MGTQLSRRDFVRMAPAASVALLAACGAPPAAAPPAAPTAAPAPPTAKPVAPTTPPTSAPTVAPTTAPKPAATVAPTAAPTAAVSAPAPATYAVWNRVPGAVPKAGGEAKGTFGDFWDPQSTIWTYAVGAMSRKRWVFNTLVTWEDPTATKMLPELAQTWELSADAKTALFKLRKDVTWHDGKPFTAKDVEYTMRAFVHKDTGSLVATSLKLIQLVGGADFAEGKADKIAGVKVIDDYTIELRTEAPVYFLFNIAMLPILPEHVLGQVPYKDLKDHKFTQEPLGTGPFKFSRRVPDQFVEVVRNDNYWGGKPYLDKIVSVFFRDRATAILAFEKGEIDLVAGAVGPDLQRARNVPDTILLGGAVDFPNAYSFNHTQPHLKDKRVRQALMWAIDHKAIKDALYGDFVSLTSSPLPHPLWEKKDLPNDYAHKYDPDRTRQLLKDAGWNPNQELLLLYYYPDQVTANHMAAVQQMWGAVGVKSQMKLLDSPSWIAAVKDKNFDMTYLGATGSADPDLTAPFISCDNMPDKPTGFNRQWYCNPELDALFDKARNVVNYEDRKNVYDQIQLFWNEELPYAPVWVPVRVAVTRKRIANATWFQDYADGNYAQEFEKWFLTG
jgi:peptide/nickel transport system substrate-binding protein